MTPPDSSTVAAAVADAHRREWAFVLAATVRVTRDLDRAEECVQEAFAAALTDWLRSGIPARPGAWLTTTARRRALNVLRHQSVEAVARIPYRVPPAAALPERVGAVPSVVHLLFTTGHTVPSDEELVRRDLLERSLELSRMLRRLLPQDPSVAGLLALQLLTDARRETRTTSEGRLLLLEEQDRSRWDRASIAEGVALVREALRSRPPSRYALQAAIAAVHAESRRWEDTDWREVVALYDVLVQLWPSPVVALNRAVAVGFAAGPAAGLTALDALSCEPQLATYGYLPAARADMLRRLGRVDEARQAYAEALLLTENTVERAFLEGRLRATGG
jgi:RNA polymerase sigma-70 factor (ECF subfamily)